MINVTTGKVQSERLGNNNIQEIELGLLDEFFELQGRRFVEQDADTWD